MWYGANRKKWSRSPVEPGRSNSVGFRLRPPARSSRPGQNRTHRLVQLQIGIWPGSRERALYTTDHLAGTDRRPDAQRGSKWGPIDPDGYSGTAWSEARADNGSGRLSHHRQRRASQRKLTEAAGKS